MNRLAALLLVAATPAGASPLDAAFDIIRKGDRIGYHAVDVTETAEGTRVETKIEMRVAFGPVTLFHYRHQAEELWRDGVLERLTSSTNNNGRKMTLAVARDGDRLAVDGAGYKGEAPLDAIPSSYWNRAIVGTQFLLNTQTGELIKVETESLGETPTPAGAIADQHRLTGSVALDLWYDGQRWVGADFIVRGEALSYRLVDEARQEQLLARLERSAD